MIYSYQIHFYVPICELQNHFLMLCNLVQIQNIGTFSHKSSSYHVMINEPCFHLVHFSFCLSYLGVIISQPLGIIAAVSDVIGDNFVHISSGREGKAKLPQID